jgi:hypothetical protein
MRYAYFPQARRLAVDAGGAVMVYDTGAHQIGGFGQQQGGDASITLSSQFGTIRLSDLAVVWPAAQAPAPQPIPQPTMQPTPQPAPADAPSGDVFAALEKLGALRDRGVLSDAEFSAKKAELLARL